MISLRSVIPPPSQLSSPAAGGFNLAVREMTMIVDSLEAAGYVLTPPPPVIPAEKEG